MNEIMRVIFDTHGGDSELNYRSGEEVTVIRELSEKEVDINDVGRMFHVRFNDGYEIDAFEDELSEINRRERNCMKASELKIDLTKERIDFAVMTALYFGNMSGNVDPTEWNFSCDYDSFQVIEACIKFAKNYDFNMISECDDEWFIDTELAREAAFDFADKMMKGMIV